MNNAPPTPMLTVATEPKQLHWRACRPESELLRMQKRSINLSAQSLSRRNMERQHPSICATLVRSIHLAHGILRALHAT